MPHSENITRPTLVSSTASSTATPDPFDLESLRLNPSFLETAGVKKLITTVPARRPNPQDFVRVHPSPKYRDNFAVIDLKDDREDYLVRPEIVPDLVNEIIYKTMYTAINRQGICFLWPVRYPSPDDYNADYARSFFLSPLVRAAREFKVQPITAQVRNPAEIESAIAKLGSEPRSGLIVMPENFTSVHRQLIISLAAQFRIPTIYPYRYFADEGGLLSYGVHIPDLFRRAAEYVSRILRGAKPADLPVQAPTKFELVINLKTARALGLVVPRILLAGADATIE